MLLGAGMRLLSSALWKGRANHSVRTHAKLHAFMCRYDAVLDQWSGVVAMTCCRSGVGLAVVNNRLFAG